MSRPCPSPRGCARPALCWLLANATNPSSSAAAASDDDDPALLCTLLEDLEALWLRHVRERTSFQYVVANEHWRDLVVTVVVGVLIPRLETDVVVDMARTSLWLSLAWTRTRCQSRLHRRLSWTVAWSPTPRAS